MQLREINRLASVPVVLMTGPADSDMVLARGASAVLQKPISCAQLNTSLKSLGLQSDQDHTHLVLIVDDDALILDVIGGLLPSPAYAVVRANGGREAIILAQRLRPSLILLDLMMPDVNGFDVFEALQQHTETANIPILVLTTKKITAQDRALLHSHPDKGFRMGEKTGLYRNRFMAEVKRALALN